MTPPALPSIRLRINRVLAGIALAWVLSMSIGVGWLTHQVIDDLMDGALRESAEVLYALVQRANTNHTNERGDMLPAPPHLEKLVWQLTDRNARVVLRSHRAPLEPLSHQGEEGFEVTAAWHVFSMPLGDRGEMLRVAQPEHARQLTIAWTVATAMALTALIGGMAAWWLNRGLRRELAPLTDLSTEVARLDPGASGATQLLATREELRPLVDAISELTQRLDQRLAHERALAAHAAHALRTPLAGMDAQLAVALKEAPDSLQPRLRQTREAAARLRRVVTALISLFRSGGELHWQLTPLSAILNRLPLESAQVACTGADSIPADPDLLSAALSNLLDNAVRHGATQVTVHASVDAGQVHVCVRDNGRGMTPEQALRLQSALDAQRTADGLGLGLTLADMVARTHGGRLKIDPRPTDSGASITMSWPTVGS